MIEACAVTDVGCVRTANEDRILADHELGAFVVADGMGGHRHGELAAEIALTTLKSFLESSRDRTDVTWPFGYNFDISPDANRLVTGIRLSNRQVWRKSEERPAYAGMGTTIASVLIDGDSAAVANVGDSRVYLFREGALDQLSVDDTWVNSVLQRGTLTEQQLLNHPMRNMLTQAAGSQTDIDVHTTEVQLRAGDVLLLSSDGLHGVVPTEEILPILASGEPLQREATLLIEAALRGGAPDNVSCILVGVV